MSTAQAIVCALILGGVLWLITRMDRTYKPTRTPVAPTHLWTHGQQITGASFVDADAGVMCPLPPAPPINEAAEAERAELESWLDTPFDQSLPDD